MSQPDHDDPVARTVAENQLGDALYEHGHLYSHTNPNGHDQAVRDARSLLAAYPSVRFETSDGTGGQVPARRMVITGPWEVDPTQH
jgi:hypothetical protein